jgi:hypothetical protein
VIVQRGRLEVLHVVPLRKFHPCRGVGQAMSAGHGSEARERSRRWQELQISRHPHASCNALCNESAKSPLSHAAAHPVVGGRQRGYPSHTCSPPAPLCRLVVSGIPSIQARQAARGTNHEEHPSVRRAQ